MDLFSLLIWVLVGLGAVAVALGVMVMQARRMGVNGNGHDHHGEDDDADRPPRPPRGGNTSPLKIPPREYRALRLADFHNDARAMRDFGELVTVAALAADGWRKLPSHIQGGQGIDVLVVRDIKGAGGFEARAVEVKTSNTAHNPESMSDERVAAALGRLHDIGAFDAATLEELLRGLWQGPPYFRKEIWHHHLDTGVTAVMEVDETGQRMTSRLRSSAHLMDALFQTLKQFDRKADYVDRPVVEVPEGEMVHASARRLLRRKKGQQSFLAAYARAFTFRRPPKKRA